MIKLIDLSRDKVKGVRSIEATFMKNGELVPLRVSEEDKPETFRTINSMIEEPGANILELTEKLYNLMSPVAKVEATINSSYYLSGNLSVVNGTLKFGEHELENTLSTHMLSLLDEENVPKNEKLWKSYVRFLDNLFQNVNEEIRNQLFRWMEYENRAGNGFAITDDGCIVGYKGCKGTILEPYSSFTGNAIVDGEEIHGHIPNKVGSVIQMPRSEVQFDPKVGCSFGLHVGTRDYAVQWAPILLLVKVNPRDIVSVPYECDSQKMRVCEYTVLKVTDASEEHKMFHPEEDDYEDWCEDDDYDGDYDEDFEEYEEDEEDFEDYEEDYEDDLEDYEDDFEENYCGNKISPECINEFLDKVIYIEYDGKDFEGAVVEIYEDLEKPGLIMKDENQNYKHIKIDRITYYEIIGDLNPNGVNSNKENDKEAAEFLSLVIKSIINGEDFSVPF